MNDSSNPVRPAGKFIWIAGIALLSGYLILGWIGSNDGISSLDANGIIHVVDDRLQTGAVEISRPPGHPLSEYWILPSLARVLQLTGISQTFSPFDYGLYQMAGGLFCLLLFWLLLGELSIPPPQRLLAMACLAFSPQFLITSSDGEEFLWGMGCVMTALLLISRLSKGAIRNPLIGWCFSVAFAVAASGYRIEYGAVALLVVFGTLLVSDESWPRKFGLGGFALLLFLIVWLPVLTHQGAVAPYPNPLSLKTRLATGIYKILFHAWGLAPILIASVAVFQSRSSFQVLPSLHRNILNYWSLWMAFIFFGLFFVYPTKILVVLPGVACLILISAAHAGRWTWLLFVVASMSVLLFHLDFFSNRHWTGPKLQASLWAQNLAEKPSSLGPKVEAAAQLAATGPHIIISDLWPWGLAWQKTQAGWTGRPDARSVSDGWAEAYTFGPGIVASRSFLDDHPTLVRGYVQQGYDIWIDQGLYREMYMRYDLSAPTPETAVVAGQTCKIVDVK